VGGLHERGGRRRRRRVARELDEIRGVQHLACRRACVLARQPFRERDEQLRRRALGRRDAVRVGEIAAQDIRGARIVRIDIATRRPRLGDLGEPGEGERGFGLDDYIILQKTPKIHLQDAISEPVTSITTGAPQKLLFDRSRISVAAGRRVAVVDDVISTGASLIAAMNILRRVGAQPVVVGAMLTEASTWRVALGDDAALVHSLGGIPVFRRERSGELVEDWDGSSNRDVIPASLTPPSGCLPKAATPARP